MSGKCICKPGISGDKCDTCPDGTSVTLKGCEGCKFQLKLLGRLVNVSLQLFDSPKYILKMPRFDIWGCDHKVHIF